MESAGPPADSGRPSVAEAFEIDNPTPYEVQQTVHRYLSQKTRHDAVFAVKWEQGRPVGLDTSASVVE